MSSRIGRSVIPPMIGVLFLLLANIFSFSSTSPQTILCLIHTATPSHETRAKTILETWAQHCDDFLFFTDSKMNDSIPHVYYPLLTERDHSWEKIRRVFKYVRDKMPRKYDWYYRADDDTYALIHNMRTLLSNYSSTKQHYLGLRWNFFTPRGFNDGSSYIFSRPTMEAFNEIMLDPDRCPDQHRAEEDQELAKCLAHIEIYPEDIRDEFGSEPIQHWHPYEQYDLHKNAFNRRLSYYPVMKEEDNFSSKTISFHHVSPFEMRMMEYIFYYLDK